MNTQQPFPKICQLPMVTNRQNQMRLIHHNSIPNNHTQLRHTNTRLQPIKGVMVSNHKHHTRLIHTNKLCRLLLHRPNRHINNNSIRITRLHKTLHSINPSRTSINNRCQNQHHRRTRQQPRNLQPTQHLKGFTQTRLVSQQQPPLRRYTTRSNLLIRKQNLLKQRHQKLPLSITFNNINSGKNWTRTKPKRDHSTLNIDALVEA